MPVATACNEPGYEIAVSTREPRRLALADGNGWQDQASGPSGSAWLRIGAVKGYADGSLGSTTAYFFEPYTDAPNTRGLLSDEMQPLDAMRARLVGADRAGLQLCIHAIGDAGISQILDLFGEVVRANGDRDRRFRIEHAQHIAPRDFDRFASLNVIASVQPYHAIDDGRWAERRIGPERIKTTYAFGRCSTKACGSRSAPMPSRSTGAK